MKVSSLYHVSLVTGRGVGQVMFQNNAFSGLLVLVGIFLNSWQMGVLAVSGNAISTLAAYLSGFRKEDIKDGLYGFNGTLVGLAVGVFMPVTLGSFLLMAVASCVSTWILRLFGMQRLFPPFTAPFIISVWILLGVCAQFAPDMLLVSDGASLAAESLDVLQALGMGIGQVMFQGNVLTGIFFLAALLVNSRVAAAYTLLGTLLPLPLAIGLGGSFDVLNAGLMGYNGALCAIALGGTSWKSFMWASCSVLLSVVLQIAGMEWGITTLTAPFVLSVWMVMGLQKIVRVSGRKV